jgi:transposase
MQTHPIRKYPTRLSDEEWEQIKSLVPTAKSGDGKRGRPCSLERRDLVDAIFYVNRFGCAWRLLPSELIDGGSGFPASAQIKRGSGSAESQPMKKRSLEINDGIATRDKTNA